MSRTFQVKKYREIKSATKAFAIPGGKKRFQRINSSFNDSLEKGHKY